MDLLDNEPIQTLNFGQQSVVIYPQGLTEVYMFVNEDKKAFYLTGEVADNLRGDIERILSNKVVSESQIIQACEAYVNKGMPITFSVH